jgi:hypothetical protein
MDIDEIEMNGSNTTSSNRCSPMSRGQRKIPYTAAAAVSFPHPRNIVRMPRLESLSSGISLVE